jgi:predicted transcriptional regulator
VRSVYVYAEPGWLLGERNILNNRRSEIDIMHEILTLTMQGARKTQILYQVNLSYTLLKNYLVFLVTNGFIEEVALVDTHGSYVTYRITDKGSGFMNDLTKVKAHLG